MGPRDTYLCQLTPDTRHFWGDPRSLSLATTFPPAAPPTTLLPANDFLQNRI